MSGIYTIASDRSFANALAEGVLAQADADQATLARTLLLLPTRRACRAVREAFLARSNGKPLLLPRLQPLGDVDADELHLLANSQIELNISPAIHSVRRQLLLSRLIAAKEKGAFQPGRHVRLARALGRLMDQIYTENLSLSDLPDLVSGREFAAHWQITVEFLKILSEAWPAILAEEGVIDGADRRNRLINALADHWDTTPPDYPIIAAGSTGSLPATARLLGVIAHLPQGTVILPGLDTHMPQEAWDAVTDGHPQATMKHLLTILNYPRARVREWPDASKTLPSPRVRLASELMRPATQSDQWQSLHWPAAHVKEALANLKLIEADSPQAEAESIALLLREILEDDTKTALVITPDRALAARISAVMTRWGVQLDDSAGRPLLRVEPARFFVACAEAVTTGLQPVPLLAMLRHPLCCLDFSKDFDINLEKGVLRGLTPPPGPNGLLAHFRRKLKDPKERNKPEPALETDLLHLAKIVGPFHTLCQADGQPLDILLDAHIELAEQFAGPRRLWQGEDGEALALFLSQLREQVNGLPPVRPAEYPLLLKELLMAESVRPSYGTHPRLALLGQIEARLIHAHRVILAGLNEGTWPPDSGVDPFLSRPMKQQFGLPPPERTTGLSAHDFVQGFCAAEVYLTRSRTMGGAPAIPARWLSRLDTVLNALSTSLDILRHPDIEKWRTAIHHVDAITPATRPAPTPAVSLRPRRLSVTRIETWLKDPYSIFAQGVLGLEKLKPLEQAPDAAGRGTLIHAILERFGTETARALPGPRESEALFLSLARDILPHHMPRASDQAVIWPRLVRLAGWFTTQEALWRQEAAPGLREIKGVWTIERPGGPFILSGIADRIDTLRDGTAAIIDYKTGGASENTPGAIMSGKLPQLPLEALMLKEAAYGVEKPRKTGTLSYWIVSGGKIPGQANAVTNSDQIEDAVRAVEAALYDLIDAYDNPQTPYFSLPLSARAPRFNDYLHLARVQEWTALDSGEEAA